MNTDPRREFMEDVVRDLLRQMSDLTKDKALLYLRPVPTHLFYLMSYVNQQRFLQNCINVITQDIVSLSQDKMDGRQVRWLFLFVVCSFIDRIEVKGVDSRYIKELLKNVTDVEKAKFLSLDPGDMEDRVLAWALQYQ